MVQVGRLPAGALAGLAGNALGGFAAAERRKISVVPESLVAGAGRLILGVEVDVIRNYLVLVGWRRGLATAELESQRPGHAGESGGMLSDRVS